MNTMHIEDTDFGRRLHLDGEVTVYSAFYFRDAVLAAVPADGELEVDLSGISDIDAAGLQVMLQLKSKCPTSLRFTNHSPVVQHVLQICRLTEFLGDQTPQTRATCRI